MNHSSQLWLNRSRSLITIPPDNSPRSLTFSTRINRLIRYQRIIISLSNYLISSNKYFIGQQYSSQFRIERKLHAKSSFVEKFRTFEYCSLFFFFSSQDLCRSIERQRLWGTMQECDQMRVSYREVLLIIS